MREEVLPGEGEPSEPPAPEAAPAGEPEFLNDVTQIYLNEIGANPLLTPEQELSYARLTRQGDEGARQKMIEHNLRLVVNIAKHYQSPRRGCGPGCRA